MIEELRELFAKLYAAGCEHDNYAYALSDALNAEVDAALLKAFKNDLGNLIARCEIVSKTEKYALEHMRAHIPGRHFSWRKFRFVPNAAASAISDVLEAREEFFADGAAAQTTQIELAIRLAQSGDMKEPEGMPLEEDPAEVAEMLQNAPQERGEATGTEEPAAGAEAAGEPESGNESAAELWDEEEADEDETTGDAA